jgi:flagellar basal body-associated protein FliL
MFFGAGKRQFLWGWRRVNSFYWHLKKGTRFLLLLIAALVVLVVVYVVQSWWHKNKVSADVASFYPAKCLGGWQYVAHAENMPDLDISASVDDFNEINSAVLDNAMAQLYCSNFNGADPLGTVPQKVSLRLSLAVKDKVVALPPVTESSEQVDGGQETGEQSGESVPETEGEAGDKPAQDAGAVQGSESTDNNSAPAVGEPVTQPVESAPATSEPTSWLPRLWNDVTTRLAIAPARAQEAEAPAEEPKQEPVEVIPTSSGESQPETVPTPEEAAPEVKAENEVQAVTGESEVSTPSSSEVIDLNEAVNEVVADQGLIEPVMPADALLQVSYTLDGQTWRTLGWVPESNWRNVKFDLPLTGIEDWSNLDWLQIRLDRVATLNDNQPVFYLDGMVLEAEYAEVLEEDFEVPEGIDQPSLKKDKLLKQKVGGGWAVINVLREGVDQQELWYRKNVKNLPTGTIEMWHKIEIEGETGYPELLDLRSGIVFWVSHRSDKKMLASYNLLTGNSSMNDVVSGGLSSLSFDEKLDKDSDFVNNVLYYLDEGESYYFGK